MKQVLAFFFVIYTLNSCVKNNKQNTVARNFDLIDNIQSPFEFSKRQKSCKNEIEQNLNFEINFHNKELLKQNMTFMIIADTILYANTFREKIQIEKIKICMDNDLSQCNPLTFAMVDKKNKKLYIWGSKDNCCLYNKKLFKASLNWDNNKEYSYQLE